MTKGSSWTRRHTLLTGLGLAGAGALAGGPAAAQLAAPAIQRGTRLTYWGGLIFSDRANKLMVDGINAWGARNGVQTEVVMINQNETVQKVSAAVASGSMPDALDLNPDLLLLLSRQGQFVPVDDLFQRIGAAQGGWFKAVADATDTTGLAGGRTGIPYGCSGNLLLRRVDELKKVGLTAPPRTWAELVEQAAKVHKPPLFGLGLALSNVGDGNLQVSVLHSFGGRLADESGKRPVLKSDETRSYLAWVKDAWDKKLFPPGVTTWDGAGDNQAYLSGQAAFIANTGSVGIAAKSQDPELYAGTDYSALPAGPKGSVSPIQPNLRAIPKTSRNPEAAKALIEHLASPEFMNAYFESAIYGPVLQAQVRLPAFSGKDRLLSGLLDLVQKGTPPAFPDVYNAAYADAHSNFVIPRMVQRVVVDNYSFDRAMDEAQGQLQAIYAKYG